VPALTRDHYFEAALDVIAREGVGALTIAKLCDRLDVTIGSFYHHFKGSKEFLAAFFVWWETTHGSALADQARLEPDPVARLRLLKKLSAGIAHGAEAAIRTWSTSHPDAAAAQSRLDEARIEVVHDTLRQLGLPAGRARTLAVMAVGVLVGAQQMGQGDDTTLMRRVFDELENWLGGVAASA
jgi:AcrR family transcriptional regulator